MANALDDGMRIGACISLKIQLTILHDSLHHLIDDLSDRAIEARAETHPSPQAGLQFKKLFDAAVRDFWRTTGLPTSGGTSCLNTIYDHTLDFSNNLVTTLPNPSRQVTSPSTCSSLNWKDQLNAAADLADKLVSDLHKIHSMLRQEHQMKTDLCANIDQSIERLRKVL